MHTYVNAHGLCKYTMVFSSVESVGEFYRLNKLVIQRLLINAKELTSN